MAVNGSTIAFLTALCMFPGCRSAHEVHDQEYAQVVQAVYASWQASIATGDVVNPVADELAGPQPVETYIQFALSQNPGIQSENRSSGPAAP